MTTTTAAHQAPPQQDITRVAALTTASALATNLSLFAGARAAGLSFEFHQPGAATGTQTVSAGALIGATVIAMTIGWVLAGLAAWRHRPSLGTLATLGGVAAVVSVLAPLALDADPSARLTLASIHLVTGAFFVTGVTGVRRTGIRTIR